MNKKAKILISSVAIISLTVGIVFFTRDNKLDDKKPQEPTDVNQDNKVDNNKKPTIPSDSENKDTINTDLTNQDNVNDDNSSLVSTKPSSNGTSNKKPNNSGNAGNNNNNNSTEKPIIPDIPSVPSVPEELEDLFIDNSMVTNGAISVSNKKYDTITINSDIAANVKITLNNVETKNGLILYSPKNYQLDITNSNLPSVSVASNIMRMSFFSLRARTYNTMNKSLEGPTINLNGTSVGTINIESNVEINSTTNVDTIFVNAGSTVVLNVPTKNAILNTQGVVSINQKVDSLVNSGLGANIIVNAPVTTFENEEKSTIRINSNQTVSNFTNKGANTIVSGNGTITDANVEANNTQIYTNVTNTPVISNDVDYVIRKEQQIGLNWVRSTSQSSVSFELSEPVQLTIKDISVICTAGKSISLYKLTTKDNKTYNLSTSYYKNNSYGLYITLPNGNIISQDFDTDYANPTVDNVVVERISDNEATLELYGIDEGGHLYYVIQNEETRETISSETVKANGTSVAVKVGYNKVSIKGLEAGKTYNIYYALEGFFDNLAKAQGPFEIPAQVKPKDTNEYQITYAAEEISNRFVFTLNKIPNKELTLNDFQIICPTEHNLTINGATFNVTPNGLTYVIVVPDNYGHKDNKYTVRIKISDEETIESSFVSHFDPPAITDAVDNVKRTGENTAKFNFYSDEAGTMYYGVFEWNGAIYAHNSSTPFAHDILNKVNAGNLEGIKQHVLTAGQNTVNIDLTGITITRNTRVWALFIDYDGNYRTGFVDHYKIPENIEPEKPDTPESTLKIIKFDVRDNNYFSIDFNETISWITQDDLEISIVKGGSLPSKLSYSIYNDEPKHLSIGLNGYTLTAGTYRLTIHAMDANETPVDIVQEFEIK